MAEARNIDWDAIERDYRAGILTLREIAAQHDITHGAVNKRAKKYEWSRDLSAKIEQKRKELVSKAAVSSSVSKTDEVSIIKSAAEHQAGALLVEREEIRKLSSIADGFEEELENNPMENSGFAMDLEKRTKILKSLSEVREKIINLRRRNFGINDNANGDADKKPAASTQTTDYIGSLISKLNAAQ